MDSLGERIKLARAKAKITQEELGKKIGTTGVTVMRYEKNLREPSLATLHLIAQALSVNLDYFFDSTKPTIATCLDWYVDLESNLNQIGYDLDFYEDDAYLWIVYPDGTLEVTDMQLKRLYEETTSFLKFKLEELKNNNIANFRRKKPDKT